MICKDCAEKQRLATQDKLKERPLQVGDFVKIRGREFKIANITSYISATTHRKMFTIYLKNMEGGENRIATINSKNKLELLWTWKEGKKIYDTWENGNGDKNELKEKKKLGMV